MPVSDLDPSGGWGDWLNNLLMSMSQDGGRPGQPTQLPGAVPAAPAGSSWANLSSWLNPVSSASAAEAPPPDPLAAAANITTAGATPVAFPPVPTQPYDPLSSIRTRAPAPAAPYDPLSSISTGRPYGAAGYAMPPYAPGANATATPTPPHRPVTPTPGQVPNLGYYRPSSGLARGPATWTPYANPNDPRLYRGPLSMFGRG